MPFVLTFERPWLLLLLGLLPLVWWLGFRSLAGLGGLRRVLALLLRSLVLTLLVLALAEMSWQKRTDQLTVIYLLDQSESIPVAKRSAMLKFVFESVARHRREKDKAGVVIFGANARIEAPPYEGQLPLIGELESDLALRTDATNLEAALKLAKASLPEDSAGRIVVVSDGNENLGDGLTVARGLAADGIGVDVVPIELPPRAEIAVEKILLPSDIRKGQKFEARVLIDYQPSPGNTEDAAQTGKETTGKLRLTQRINQREELIAEQQVTLRPGKNVVALQHQLEQSAIVSFAASFLPDDPTADGVLKNNQASAFTHVRGKGKVLLIEDGSFRGEFTQFIERLQANAIEVDLMSSSNLFGSAAELLQYDSIILANVPRATGDDAGNAEAFSDEQIRMLVSNCENMGCGIVMLGGDRAFGAGGWANTELERAMPVDFQIKNDKVNAVGALALMMHASEMADGNFWQLKIAKEALNILGPMDYAGVIDWSDIGGAPKWLWRLPAGVDRVSENRNRMLALIGRMTPGDMPEFDAPMKLAVNGLLKAPASIKHMIIISDGDPAPPTRAVMQACKDNKITITTVAVGTHGPAGSTPLKDIAEFTGGKYYEVKDARALPKIYQREARRVSKPVIRESKSGMRALGVAGYEGNEILQGITPGELPPFFGYVMTTLKSSPLVEQLLVSNDPPDTPENSTLLASWRYGVGRTVVFSSDAGNQWTTNWYSSEYYDKLFSQLVRYSMRPVTRSANFSVGTEFKDSRGRIVITASDDEGEYLNFLNLTARGLDPRLQDVELNFTQTAPGRYVAEFPANDPGNYLFSIFPEEGYERLTAGLSAPYSSEFSVRSTNLALLESLAGVQPKGGSPGVLATGDLLDAGLERLLELNPFRSDLFQVTSIQGIWPGLLLWAAVLFWFDVLTRRVALSAAPLWTAMRNWLARIRGQEPVLAGPSLERLRTRKLEVGKQLELKRANTRFEPESSPSSSASGKELLDAVLESEIAKERDPLPPKPITQLDQPEESHTARLLEAKRRARQNRPDK
ncbi:MAG: VWA domain-containing protein [Planctomycetota bacterium]